MRTHQLKIPTGAPCFSLARVRGALGSLRGRLASSRSVEITGFTLVELLMVIVIIAILATIAFYLYTNLIERARVTRAIIEVELIAGLVEAYNEEYATYPRSLSDLGREEFVSKYGRCPAADPWGNAYQYVNLATDWGQRRKDRNLNPINNDFDLWSNGSDGDSKKQVNQKESRDDIIRAWDGAFIGLGKTLDELYGKPKNIPWKPKKK